MLFSHPSPCPPLWADGVLEEPGAGDDLLYLTFLFHIAIKKVMTYRHGLPDETWHEPDPQDPLSLIDQVKEFTLP